MNRAKKILMKASSKLELPADILAGLPRIELLGKEQCSVEPHCGLLVYGEEKICVQTDLGVVSITGNNMQIKPNTVILSLFICLICILFPVIETTPKSVCTQIFSSP